MAQDPGSPEVRDIQSLLQKARESLEAAQLLLERGFYGFSASRSYYAMFYAAEAALLRLGLTFSKHAGVIAGFGQHLVRPGKVPNHLHRYLLDAFDLRMVGDYDTPGRVDESRAHKALDRAKEFVREMERFLAKEAQGSDGDGEHAASSSSSS